MMFLMQEILCTLSYNGDVGEKLKLLHLCIRLNTKLFSVYRTYERMAINEVGRLAV